VRFPTTKTAGFGWSLSDFATLATSRRAKMTGIATASTGPATATQLTLSVSVQR
jgi:hypothetical protein